MLSIICAAVAAELVAMVGIIVSKAVSVPWVAVPFLLGSIYAAIFFVVYFNVALAGAARMSIDGRDTKLRDGLAVARQRRGVIAEWALFQFGLGLLISVLGSLLGGGGEGRSPLGDLLGVLAGAAWSVASFFVIPVLALEGLGPRAALKRSLTLVREHWGEGLTGSVSIGGIVFLVAVLPLAGIIVAADALAPVTSLASAVTAIAVLAVIATFALGTALGVIFRVELYRYATEGELTGRFAQQDIDAAFRRKG